MFGISRDTNVRSYICTRKHVKGAAFRTLYKRSQKAVWTGVHLQCCIRIWGGGSRYICHLPPPPPPKYVHMPPPPSSMYICPLPPLKYVHMPPPPPQVRTYAPSPPPSSMYIYPLPSPLKYVHIPPPPPPSSTYIYPLPLKYVHIPPPPPSSTYIFTLDHPTYICSPQTSHFFNNF